MSPVVIFLVTAVTGWFQLATAVIMDRIVIAMSSRDEILPVGRCWHPRAEGLRDRIFVCVGVGAGSSTLSLAAYSLLTLLQNLEVCLHVG